MSSQVTPKKNAAFSCYVSLTSQANPLVFQSNPTLATGDAKVSIDGGALNDLATLPDVDPNSSKLVKIALSSSEMNGDNIQVVLSDAAGAEWCDLMINIQTTARQIDDLAFPQTSGRGELVAADGSVSPNWADIKSPTTTVNLSGTTVKTATDIATQIAALNNLSSSDVTTIVAAALTATVADSIPADGTRPSIASGILWLTRFLGERSVSGLTMTVKKEDGTTANMTFTLNDPDNPTSITRAT